MNSFMCRVRRLQECLEMDKKHPAILIYRDGTVREMRWMDAFTEIGNGADVVAVKYPDKTGESLLAAMLPGIENSADLWGDLDV